MCVKALECFFWLWPVLLLHGGLILVGAVKEPHGGRGRIDGRAYFGGLFMYWGYNVNNNNNNINSASVEYGILIIIYSQNKIHKTDE